MYRDQSTTSEEYSLRTDGSGAPLTREKPQRQADRAVSHWCDEIGSRRFCPKEQCAYCGRWDGDGR
ncbi:hypothetical protein [Halobellus ordinarius]|uniref:hypothetical protein n=1 Tax=Halobellus ordinarius TaxID=3075120 RepID=UPI002880AE88|nr:hypothetical protein [Halobellus sp. ZY16]